MRTIRILSLALVVAACALPPPQSREFPRITFAHLPQIALDVSRVEVRNRYRSPVAVPNVEHRFPVSPAAAAMEWGRQRFRAAGESGVARITLRRASVVEVPLTRTGGVAGLFKIDQSERYDAVVDMKLEIVGPNGRVRATVESVAKRSRTVSENISAHGREEVWFEMTEALMADMDRSLDAQIRDHLKEWLREP